MISYEKYTHLNVCASCRNWNLEDSVPKCKLQKQTLFTYEYQTIKPHSKLQESG